MEHVKPKDMRHKPFNISAKALLILQHPVSELTYEDLALRVGLTVGSTRRYCRKLRATGLLSVYTIPMRRIPDGWSHGNPQFSIRAAKEAHAAFQKSLATAQAADTRTKLPKSVWDVYAQTIPEEEMTRWFRLV